MYHSGLCAPHGRDDFLHVRWLHPLQLPPSPDPRNPSDIRSNPANPISGVYAERILRMEPKRKLAQGPICD